MARIKKEEELKVNETPEVAAEETKVEAPATTENTETEAEVGKAEVEVKAIEPTDAGILKTLKCFPELDEAYVDTIGCVFTKGTPAVVIGKAVLYKNPYFNK